jgi:hypothetical protein
VPAITAVFTLAAVAQTLGVSEELLHDLSIDMEPEDGCIGVYGPGDAYTPAFTKQGIGAITILLDEKRQLDLPLNPT